MRKKKTPVCINQPNQPKISIILLSLYLNLLMMYIIQLTGSYNTQHFVLYRKVRWIFPSERRDVHAYLFIYKVILYKLSLYSISPLCYNERSVMPIIPHA